MEIMLKSVKFQRFVDMYDEQDIDRLATLSINEIKKKIKLGKEKISRLVLHNDIQMINQKNYARIFDMLHEFAFDNFEILLDSLNETNIASNIVYNDKKLDKNFTLKAIFEETCICDKNKCRNLTDAVKNYHPYCIRIYLEDPTLPLQNLNTLKPSENFYSSLEWLLANGYLDDKVWDLEEYYFFEQVRCKDILMKKSFSKNNIRMAKLLFKYGANTIPSDRNDDPDDQDYGEIFGSPPDVYNLSSYISMIIGNCSFDMIKLFFENNVNNEFDFSDSVGYLSLQTDRFTEDEIIEIMKYLIERGASLIETLSDFLYHGCVKVAQWLVSVGQKPISLESFAKSRSPKYEDYVELLNMGFTSEMINLQRAAYDGDSKVCMLLLDYHIDVIGWDFVEILIKKDLKDVYMKLYNLEKISNTCKIIMAICINDTKFVANYFDKHSNTLSNLQINLIINYGNEELKEYFISRTKGTVYVEVCGGPYTGYGDYGSEYSVVLKKEPIAELIDKLKQLGNYLGEIYISVNFKKTRSRDVEDAIEFLESLRRNAPN